MPILQRSAFEVYVACGQDTSIYHSLVDFRSHGDWSAQFGLRHLKSTLRKAEVSNHDSVIVQEQIGQLEVSVHHLVLVEHLEAIHDLLQEEDTLLLREMSVGLLGEVVFEVAFVAVVDHQVVSVFGLQVVEEVHHIRVVDRVHDANLVL